jgi:hypothetical protein
MTLPMFDILAALVRRRLTGRSFDTPDRLHIHHRLLARGWNPWQVLCLIGALCLATGAAATAATIFRRDALAWITAMTLVALMIRLRLFGHEEFALAKGAVVRRLKSHLAFLIRVTHLSAVRGSGFRIQDSRSAPSRVLNPEPRTLNPELSAPGPGAWDIFVSEVRAWNIREVEFCLLQDHRPRRIRWIDPAAPINENCRWSLSVSLPGGEDAFCELRAAGAKPMINQNDLAALESLLKTFGTQFAAHAEQIFGPLVPLEGPAAAGAHSDRRRQAA